MRNLGFWLFIVIIVWLITFPFTCCFNNSEASEPWTSITGFGIQFEGSLSDLEDVHMTLAGIRYDIFGLNKGKFRASIEPEIFGGYRLNGDNGWLVAFQPVFRFSYTLGDFEPFINLIVGVSYNNMHIDGMGLDFNFTPTGGMGLLWTGWKVMPLLLEYRMIHLSNSGLSEKNEGLNMHSLFIGRKF